MSNERGTAKTGWFLKGNRKMIALATGIAIAIGGFFGIQAFANSNAYGHMKLYTGYSGGWHGGHHKGFADISEADIEAQIERIVKHAAIEIDATQEQQEKIIELVTAVARDLKPVHDQMRVTGKKFMICSWPTRSTGPRLKRCAASALRTPSKLSRIWSAHWLMWPKYCPWSSARCSTS